MKRLLFQILFLFAFIAANAQNPYLPLWEHLPDGEPRVLKTQTILGNSALILLVHTTSHTPPIVAMTFVCGLLQ